MKLADGKDLRTDLGRNEPTSLNTITVEVALDRKHLDEKRSNLMAQSSSKKRNSRIPPPTMTSGD